jgi:cell division protein FtsQ
MRLPQPRLPRWSARLRQAAVLASVLALATAGGWWLYRSPMLSIRDVKVEGNTVISAELTRGIADLDGRSIFRPNLDGARERVLALPAVKEANIERDWPNGARISIVERVPWGVWQVGATRFAVDADGVVLDRPASEGAPVIVQTDAPSSPLVPGSRVDPGAVALARELLTTAERTVGRSVVGLEFSQGNGLTAVLADDLRVTFGDVQGYEFKVAALFAVLQQATEDGRTLHRVDLRFGDRVAVQ